jgi:hypothetical protein
MLKFACSVLLAISLVSSAKVGWAKMPQIWFAPLDNVPRPFNGTQGSPDFMRLFDESSPWRTSAGHVSVFKIYPQFIERAPLKDIKKLFGDLRRRHIALALEFGAMTDTAACGKSIEGYNGENLGAIAIKIQKLGGELSYLAMDEPLWYGHHYSGRRACHAAVSDIAKDVVVNIERVKKVFPGVKIGDIEPIPQNKIQGWDEEIKSWAHAFEAAAGYRLDFLQADILWGQPWMPVLSELYRWAKDENIALGIIYKGGPADRTDEAWLSQARQHYEEIENSGILPDQAVFQSWTNNPTVLLPEESPLAMTNLILEYFRRHDRDVK